LRNLNGILFYLVFFPSFLDSPYYSPPPFSATPLKAILEVRVIPHPPILRNLHPPFFFEAASSEVFFLEEEKARFFLKTFAWFGTFPLPNIFVSTPTTNDNGYCVRLIRQFLFFFGALFISPPTLIVSIAVP